MKKSIYFLGLLVFISCGHHNGKKESNTTDSLNGNTTTVDSSVNNTNSNTGTDTSFTDLSGRYKVTIPSFPDSTLPNIVTLNAAVIPVDSLGAVKISWNDNQQQLTKETEKEFETELLNCTDGKDKKGEASAVTSKKPGYCLRTGYSDMGMGHIGYDYYVSYVKDNKMVVIELFTSWSACTTGYETEAEMKACREEKKKAEKDVDNFIDNLVANLKISRI